MKEWIFCPRFGSGFFLLPLLVQDYGDELGWATHTSYRHLDQTSGKYYQYLPTSASLIASVPSSPVSNTHNNNNRPTELELPGRFLEPVRRPLPSRPPSGTPARSLHQKIHFRPFCLRLRHPRRALTHPAPRGDLQGDDLGSVLELGAQHLLTGQ